MSLLLRLLPALLLVLPATLPAETTSGADRDKEGRIEVTVRGVRPELGGHIIVLLYGSGKNWLEPQHARQKIVLGAGDAGTVTAALAPVPYGTSYAVQAFHDANGNGTMDFRWFPYPRPTEGAGVSNNHRRMGRPRFDDARLDVDASTLPVTIDLFY